MDLPISVGSVFRSFSSPSSARFSLGAGAKVSNAAGPNSCSGQGRTRAQAGIAHRDFTLAEVTNCVILC